MEFYKILNLEPNCSYNEIKKSYYKLAKLYHPDKNNGHADKFKEINLAYTFLSKNHNNNQNIEHEFDYKQLLKKLYNDYKPFFYKNLTFLNINKNIDIHLIDLYSNNNISFNIKKINNNNINNLQIILNLDIYDEQLIYDNQGHQFMDLTGKLIIDINLLYDKSIYEILDNYNILVNINNNNMNKIKIMNKYIFNELNKIIISQNNNMILYKVENHGFYDNDNNKYGNLYIKYIH